MISPLFVLATVLAVVNAKPVSRGTMAVHETRDVLPPGFTDVGPADDSTVITLRAALVQNNIPGLEQELYAVSTPGSPRYGQHLSKEEVGPLFSS